MTVADLSSKVNPRSLLWYTSALVQWPLCGPLTCHDLAFHATILHSYNWPMRDLSHPHYRGIKSRPNRWYISEITNCILSLPLPVVGLKMKPRSLGPINRRYGQWRPVLMIPSQMGWVPLNWAHQKIHHRQKKPQRTPNVPCITEESITTAHVGHMSIVDKGFLGSYKTHHCVHQGKCEEDTPLDSVHPSQTR